MKPRYILLFAVPAALSALSLAAGCGCDRNSTRNGRMTKPNMDELIERLADVHKKPVTIGGEAVVYRPKEDKTVRQEILARGFDAVPALIAGLTHEREDVAGHCAALLAKLPRRSGVKALIQLIEKKTSLALLAEVHTSLHLLTGVAGYFPPGGVFEPEVAEVKALWLPWWEANKDRLVDTETGIGFKNDDGTITPLPLKEDRPGTEEKTTPTEPR